MPTFPSVADVISSNSDNPFDTSNTYWRFVPASLGQTLVAGDVLVIVIFGNRYSGPWSYTATPGDWALLEEEAWTGSWFGASPMYNRFSVFTKVWGSGDDQSTYVAEWDANAGLVPGSFSYATPGNQASLCILDSDGGAIAAGTTSVELDAPIPGSYAYPSAVEFNLPDGSGTTDLVLATLTIGSATVYLAGTGGDTDLWSFTPTPDASSFTSIVPGVAIYFGGYAPVTPPPPSDTIRVSRNIRRVRALSVT